MRSQFCLLLLAVFSVSPAAFAQSSLEALILRPVARRHGLEREWFTQLETGGRTSRIETVSYEGGTLFVQTTAGLLHAINAETGNILWTSELGSRGGEGFAAAADHTYVATISGTTLNVLNRATGLPVWTRKTVGVPQAAAGLTDQLVVIPMAGGVVEMYPLSDPEAPSVQLNAGGRRVFDPVTTEQGIYLTTDTGIMNALLPSTGAVRFTWNSSSTVFDKPGYTKPNVLVGSSNGFAYAVDELTGSTRWQFSAGDIVRRTPVGIGDTVYVMPDGGGVFAVAAADGAHRWFSPRAEFFVAASPTRVYMTDRRHQMHVLDAKTGARVDTFFLHESVRAFANVYTDRVYLFNDSGLLQCLREVTQEEPLVYVSPKVKPAEVEQAGADASAEPAEPVAKPAAAEPEEAPDALPAEMPDDAPAVLGEDPFAPAPAAEDDPFGS